jgi:hypothetical protein
VSIPILLIVLAIAWALVYAFFLAIEFSGALVPG